MVQPDQAPHNAAPQRIVNAFTCDVEDYFQVSALAPHFPRSQWDDVPCRVEHNVDRILQLLDGHGARGTFFTLGWVAERYPQLVRRIANAGHEVASHGYGHERASDLTPEAFTADIKLAKVVLEDITGQAVTGYRAPSFSIGMANLWAHDCIAKAGYAYSSSVYPVKHDHYGIPDAPRFPWRLENGLMEVPVSTVRMLGRNWPAGGGGFFRLLPYSLSRWQIARVNANDKRPAIFYFHPWEIDPEQPRVTQATARTRFRHYINLKHTEARLDRLLSDFSWGRADEVFRGAA
jgi:polysaccharide deacetylase family protein (PEP-CTERM system associated)